MTMRGSAPPALDASTFAECCRLGVPIPTLSLTATIAMLDRQDMGRSGMHGICATHKYALTISQIGHGMAIGAGVLERPMDCSYVAPSGLPSLLLPCPHCGHRMVITAVEPALFANGATANDLQDVTHGCEQCGTELTRTIRPLASAA
jgi:hypothetical protein